MFDETRERLIVMGGTTEPGVFQVEITRSGSPASGSIFHVSEVAPTNYGAFCDCDPVWEMTEESNTLIRKLIVPVFRTNGRRGVPKGLNRVCVCSCVARRID